MHKSVIGFIGGGNMATSLIGGLVRNNYPSEKIIVSDPTLSKLNLLKEKFNIAITTDNKMACQQAEILVIAVKPQTFPIVARELKDYIQHKLVISVVSGIRTQNMQRSFGQDIPIIRTMPNTPALIGSGATALFANVHAKHQHREIAEAIMRAVGITVWIKEEAQLDIVTALSGCGPAYFLYIMETLIDGAVELGLDKKTAELLTLQTALGAARIALEDSASVTELRQRVTSPGGATEQAMVVLEKNQVRQTFLQALTRAMEKARSLGEQ